VYGLAERTHGIVVGVAHVKMEEASRARVVPSEFALVVHRFLGLGPFAHAIVRAAPVILGDDDWLWMALVCVEVAHNLNHLAELCTSGLAAMACKLGLP